jgi:hypothetical protein
MYTLVKIHTAYLSMIALSPNAKDMAENLYRALWSWVICVRSYQKTYCRPASGHRSPTIVCPIMRGPSLHLAYGFRSLQMLSRQSSVHRCPRDAFRTHKDRVSPV